MEQTSEDMAVSGDVRLFCKTHGLYKINLRKATKTTFIERILLFFVKAKFSKDFETTLKYKVLRGRIFILDEWINPPKGYNCRHTLIKSKQP